jgi:cytochrome c oxidase assembly factor CtaG
MNDRGFALARPRGRAWLAAVAVVLVLISLLPPVGGYARRYVFVESLQFLLFAVAAPGLFVLGAPWRLIGLGGWRGFAQRLGGSGRGSGFRHGVAMLLVFIAAVIAWRLPVSVNALAALPGLAVLELVTLGGAGTALWLELVESPPLLPRMSRPLRALFAALPMWTIWILAYILGFSQATWFTAYSHPGLGTLADQQIATGIMWAVPALCFIPVVYFAAITWLRDSEDPDEGLRALISAERPQRSRWPRPPRGWDTHST